MHYERLSALDNSFLVQEGRFTYMHIAATAIFAPGSMLASGAGGIDIERIREYVSSRLHLVPRYRQRLGYVPLTNDPIWIDDDRLRSRLSRPAREPAAAGNRRSSCASCVRASWSASSTAHGRFGSVGSSRAWARGASP